MGDLFDSFDKDTNGYLRERDNDVIKIAQGLSIAVIVKTGRTLYEPDWFVEEYYGKQMMYISQVESPGVKTGEIARPISAPKWLPDLGEKPLNSEKETPAGEPDINRGYRVAG